MSAGNIDTNLRAIYHLKSGSRCRIRAQINRNTVFLFNPGNRNRVGSQPRTNDLEVNIVTFELVWLILRDLLNNYTI